jgi:hypothetical protein
VSSLAFAAPLAAQAACNALLAADTPDARYEINGGTVKDRSTGLIWKQCAEGLSGADCASGTALTFTWQDALKRVQTVNAQPRTLSVDNGDWRLPNKNELASLVSRQCEKPALNATAFPNSPVESYWTNSPFVRANGLAWFVDFNAGDVGPGLMSAPRRVRLVRGGN